MVYYLILAIQFFCVYHVFKHKNEYYWVFLIIFVPVIGCAVYLISNVYNKRDAEKVASDITSIINPTKKVRDLESKLQFSDTYQNRLNLADAYFEISDYSNASLHYEQLLEDKSQSNVFVKKKLLESYYYAHEYEKAIEIAETIKDHQEFVNTISQFTYGLCLEKLNKFDEAETNMKVINQRYSHYNERLVLAEFLLSQQKNDAAYDILNDINAESQHMTKPNRRIYRATINKVKDYLSKA